MASDPLELNAAKREALGLDTFEKLLEYRRLNMTAESFREWLRGSQEGWNPSDAPQQGRLT